jgi:uncharacterized protein YdeI (YjbR/CyaY-like superfamily)
MVTYKKGIIEKYVSVQEVLDQLLCFGWIDGIRRKLDEERTMQLISPRKVEHWAQTYKVRFAKLEKEGLVHQSGLDSVIILYYFKNKHRIGIGLLFPASILS